MKRRVLALAAVAVAVATAAADDKDDANKKDLKALQGTWLVRSFTKGGVDLTALLGKSPQFIVAGNKITLKAEIAWPAEDQAFAIVDATKQPAWLDLRDGKGKQVGEGIYEVKSDSLRICINEDPGGRPKEFASKAGTRTALYELKREKK
jgi:uncharacterized protein (TIGR03067 family)